MSPSTNKMQRRGFQGKGSASVTDMKTMAGIHCRQSKLDDVNSFTQKVRMQAVQTGRVIYRADSATGGREGTCQSVVTQLPVTITIADTEAC